MHCRTFPPCANDLRTPAGTSPLGFDSRWEPIGIQFPKLRLSPVVLPELFPGSSSVECDFLFWPVTRTHKYRPTLARISVEGLFQDREWEQVEFLVMLTKCDAL
jgi:hypothetical protein